MTSTILGASLSQIVLGMVAMFLALSVGIQVLQEMWKYLFSTKAGVYSRVLGDWLGAWARELLESPALADLQVRGPFQWKRLQPTGKLLPLTKENLVDGLERTATLWRQRGLEALRLEVKVQAGTPALPSAGWLAFVQELTQADAGGPQEPGRQELLRFLETPGALGGSVAAPTQIDAVKALTLYRDRFFERVIDVEQRFDRLEEVFNYQYRRRNMGLTFALSLVVALVLGLPTQRIYQNAKAMSPEETAALVATAQALYQRADSMARVAATTGTRSDSATAAAAEQAAKELAAVAAALRIEVAPGEGRTFWERIPGTARIKEILNLPAGRIQVLIGHILGCVLTAIMVCFGAPFWNDILTALGSRARPASQTSKEARNA